MAWNIQATELDSKGDRKEGGFRNGPSMGEGVVRTLEGVGLRVACV